MIHNCYTKNILPINHKQGCKIFFLLTRPVGLVGGKSTRPYDLFTRPDIGSNFWHYVDSLHHYVNVCYLFIKLEPIKQIKRF